MRTEGREKRTQGQGKPKAHTLYNLTLVHLELDKSDPGSHSPPAILQQKMLYIIVNNSSYFASNNSSSSHLS